MKRHLLEAGYKTQGEFFKERFATFEGYLSDYKAKEQTHVCNRTWNKRVKGCAGEFNCRIKEILT